MILFVLGDSVEFDDTLQDLVDLCISDNVDLQLAIVGLELLDVCGHLWHFGF